MQFLILSDIHAISGDLLKSNAYGEKVPSNCNIESISSSDNPLLSISSCLSEYKGKIDGLLCLGDLAHQAKRLPFAATWQKLHDIAKDLDIDHVIGVTGNHDKASRDSEDSDLEMQNYGKFIKPSFPYSNEIFNTQYYDKGVVGTEIKDTLVVCIDTCRLHGLGGEDFKRVFSIGSVSQSMIEEVVRLAKATDLPKVVVMMHHHPDKVHQEYDADDDVMAKGKTLLDELATVDKQIFLLHGHKHMVAVNYKRGYQSDIPVLSAASLSCIPYSGTHQLSANQFHILKFEDGAKSQQKKGEILSWEWHFGKWKTSKRDYMTHVVPIGRMANIAEIERVIRALSPTRFMDKEELIATIPEIEFATKSQIEEINEKFENDTKVISIWMDSGGRLQGLKYEELR